MQRGWGDWSPLEHEVAHLPGAYDAYSADRQCEERPENYLPDLELVLELARRCPGPILDLACGTGRISLALAARGYSVVGIDANAAFITRARRLAEASPLPAAMRPRFEQGDARSFRLPDRFGLVVMMDQAFKYLLGHDDHLDCLQAVRDHLTDEGRFLVEHRCLLKLPDAGPGETYTFTEGDREWFGADTYDAIQQIGLSAFQPADDPEADAVLQPIRDFTYAELSLLHRVVGFELEDVVSDLDERGWATTYFDAALILKKCDPWQPRR